MTTEEWLSTHPYLRPVGELQAQIQAVAAAEAVPTARTPSWDDYTGEFRAGVPLLHSRATPLDPEEAGRGLSLIAATLASTSLPGRFS